MNLLPVLGALNMKLVEPLIFLLLMIISVDPAVQIVNNEYSARLI